jgi:hypothetical protein
MPFLGKSHLVSVFIFDSEETSFRSDSATSRRNVATIRAASKL